MNNIRKKFVVALITLTMMSCSNVQKITYQVPENTATALPIQPSLTVSPMQTETAMPPTPVPTDTPPVQVDTPIPENTPTPALTSTLGPDDWQRMPVIPTRVSERVRLIYQMGAMKGNNPNAFSKVGDCNSTMPYFLGDFDTESAYDLGEHVYLQETIDYFQGSFSRKSLATKDGLTAHAAMSVLWVDWKDCETYETPLTCEYRLQRPAFAILSFGTNDANGGVDFEIAFRRVIDMTIGNGVVPILSTKADNAEGDYAINRTIARLAYEYELPLWNYWLAVQSLPDKGLRSPEHLSASPVGYSNFAGEYVNYGWSVRNLTALQVLEVMRKSIDSVE